MSNASRTFAGVLVAAVIVAASPVVAQDRIRPDVRIHSRTLHRRHPPPSSREPEAPSYVEGQPVPEGYEVVEHPRLWLLVPGLALFAPSYGLAAYEGTFGDAGSYGPSRPGEEARFHLGTKQLLLIPVFGPPLFATSFCSDAKDFYRDHPSSDEPQDACSGSSWAWVFAGVQAAGASLIAASYVWPSKTLSPASSSRHRISDWQVSVLRTSYGTPVWQVLGTF